MRDFEAGELLLINKPYGWTSFDVVNKLRFALKGVLGKKIKVGHAGTLDPLATGLLLICTGKMTKRIEEFTGMDKEYTGVFFLGATTPSYDAESAPDAIYPVAHITEEKICAAALRFTGQIEQLPPAFSAIKVSGQPAYVKARKGKEVALQPRSITIYEMTITQVALPEIHVSVKCSKGTYIRSLAHDFGKTLGSGAYLKSLCRTKIGAYTLEDALTVEQAVRFIQTLKP